MSSVHMSWQEIGDIITSHTLSAEAIKNRNEVVALIKMQLAHVSDGYVGDTDVAVLLLVMGESLLGRD